MLWLRLRAEQFDFADTAGRIIFPLEARSFVYVNWVRRCMFGEEDSIWLTAAQCRAARALLCWSVEELSARSHVPVPVITDFEIGKASIADEARRALIHALFDGGVVAVRAAEDRHDGGVLFRPANIKPLTDDDRKRVAEIRRRRRR